MTAIMIIMGLGGGPSFPRKNPIVPTNCVEASRTTVCGVEVVGGAERNMLFGPWALLNYPGRGQTVHTGSRKCWKGLGAF